MKNAPPKRQRKLDPHLITAPYIAPHIGELFRSLRMKLLLSLHEEKDKSVIISSLDAEVGKSTLSANLAVSCAQQGMKTLLVDGDLRRGVLHNTFVVEKSPGLSDILFSDTPCTDATMQPLLQTTHVPNLRVLACGSNNANPTEMLASQRFTLVKNLLSSLTDILIFDSVPMGVAMDSVVIHDRFSRYIFVARAGKTDIVALQKKLDEFPPLKKKTAGIILNRARLSRAKTSYYYMYHRG